MINFFRQNISHELNLNFHRIRIQNTKNISLYRMTSIYHQHQNLFLQMDMPIASITAMVTVIQTYC